MIKKWIDQFRNWFWVPSTYAWGGILLGGAVGGVLFWGAFNTFMEKTNTMPFCTSCHEMQNFVFEEYKETIHYQNRTGVRATCSDCHVPHEWTYKLIRKIRASNELIHKAMGSINTPEKFEAKRLTLAKNVWRAMKKTDSRECRNCHSWEAMSSDLQKRRAQKKHIEARDEGQTCIDCHKGIAHRAVHKLLDPEVDDFYDGKSDPRSLPVLQASDSSEGGEPSAQAEAQPAAATSAPAQSPAPAAAAAVAGSTSSVDWAGIEGTDVTLFYPGQASWEWTLKGSDHGGARAIRKIQDRCAECHRGEEADMGAVIVSGEKAEATPIPGKRAAFVAKVKAAVEGDALKLRFEWPDTDHTPVPFVEGGKMDPANQIKVAFMLDDGKVEEASYSGCWASCHHDSRYMPDQPDTAVVGGNAAVSGALDVSTGITKYMPVSRTELDYKGRDGAPRGGWDKLKDPAEIEALLAGGSYMDLTRYKSGDNAVETGSILAERLLSNSAEAAGSGTLENGVWTVEISRPLKATMPGGVDLAPGTLYTIGFAIHDDFTSARFHHVSLEYKLGLDNPEAEINAVTQ